MAHTLPFTGATLRTEVNRLDTLAASGRGIYHVDDYGAAGDCPRTGSTAGATDDSTAIEAALTAATEGAIVRFTPGKVYMVSRKIMVLGKGLTLDARGATIRCRDDSVWHVFVLGGVDENTTIGIVRVIGGTFDGNRINQRYYPNQNATIIYTDLGAEPLASYTGIPIYENSPINGVTWSNDWLNGKNGSSINLNAGGNDGIIRIQYAQQADFIDVTVIDYIRNGLAVWDCEYNVFENCHGRGGLSFHYFEIQNLLGLTHEGAFLKAGGHNPGTYALRGHYTARTDIRGGSCIGGHMPIFIRTNIPKPDSAMNVITVDGFEAYGFSRDVWFEAVHSIKISKCRFVGGAMLQSSTRNSPGVFLSNASTEWSITDSYISGPINTNQIQGRKIGTIARCHLVDESSYSPFVNCSHISDSLIETVSHIMTDKAVGCVFNVTGPSAVQAREVIGCTFGADEYATTATKFIATEGQTTFALPAAATHVAKITRRHREYWGNALIETFAADYSFATPTVTMNFKAKAGEEVVIHWYERPTESFTAAASQMTYDLTKPGGTRRDDVEFVTLNGTVILHKSKVTDTATVAHFTLARLATGLMRVTLVNQSVLAGDVVKVRYLPTRKSWGFLKTFGSGRMTVTGGTAMNCRKAKVQTNCQMLVSGMEIYDAADPVVFETSPDSVVDVRDCKIQRAHGSILASNVGASVAREATIQGCTITDWGLGGAFLSDVKRLRLIGGNASKAFTVGELTALTDNILIAGLTDAGSTELGATLGAACKRVVRGGNAYFGGVNAISTPFGGVSVATKADAANAGTGA